MLTEHWERFAEKMRGIERELAEVTAERDRLRDDYMDLLDGANKTGMDLAHLLDAVEALGLCPDDQEYIAAKRLFALAAKIRKERS